MSSSLSTAQPDHKAGDLPTWNLGDLYAGPQAPEIERDLALARQQASSFAALYKGSIEEKVAASGGGKWLAGAIRDYEALSDLLGRLSSYAGLLYASDTVSPVNGKFYGDMQEKLTEITGGLLFFELELNRIEDEVLEKALAASPELAYFAPWLRDLRTFRPYQLSDDIETLLHEKYVTGAGAWSRLFDQTVAALRFPLGGESVGLETALSQLSDQAPARRKAAADVLAETFRPELSTFTLILNTLIKDKEIGDRWRGYKDIADGRHLSNQVEAEVVDALAESVRRAYPKISHRYYRMKARWLGLEKLEYWDRNAPLPSADDRPIEWGRAKEIVLSAYRGFTPRMAEIAGDFFEHNWIDAQIRPGKATGAFAHSTVPSAHPYVLLNYQGKTRDVMTLAHELGHGVHQVLAGRQGALMAGTPLTLAETASVFGEMLTFRKLLADTTDPLQKKAMLASKVEDMINTVVRQMAFYQFERRLHTARREGELTSEQIGQIWMEVQRESLGDGIHLGEGYETYWCYISHFVHSPFYVYAYAFGDCLVNSLYAVYQQASEGFAERYLAMLSAGGTLRHKELLAPFGLDATDPAFWDRGLSIVSSLIDELERME